MMNEIHSHCFMMFYYFHGYQLSFYLFACSFFGLSHVVTRYHIQKTRGASAALHSYPVLFPEELLHLQPAEHAACGQHKYETRGYQPCPVMVS